MRVTPTTQLYVLRVFTGPEGGGGNPLGVVVNGGEVPVEQRQHVAADLGFSETVFLDDPAGQVAIFTPAVELGFAGHPLVGTAWLLSHLGRPVDALHPPAGKVDVFFEDDRFWIRGRAEWAPEMDLQEFATPGDVEGLDGAPEGVDFLDAWAWADADAGLVRCRVFAPVAGIAEDEATGAAAVRLVTMLGRPIEIRQGKASIILARPGPDGTAEIGGSCVLDERREYALPA